MPGMCARRARVLHEECFGCAPAFESSAPGRVNLIGDHVDYAGGFVLPMTVAQRTHVAATVDSGQDRFASEWSGDERWMRYAAGVLAELRAIGVDVPFLRIAVASDLPIGGGLSSSAALEIAVARAALAAARSSLSMRETALLCQRAEHVHAGTPCGIMDQWCIAHGDHGADGARGATLLDCANLEWRSIAIPGTLEIEVIDSGQRHALHDGDYASRRADVDGAAKALGVGHLARLPRGRWPEIERLDEPTRSRARHVVRESARVERAAAALSSGDIVGFGSLLSESHSSLSGDFGVSTNLIDSIVARELSAGALGARITGGGFGGCVVVARHAGRSGTTRTGRGPGAAEP